MYQKHSTYHCAVCVYRQYSMVCVSMQCVCVQTVQYVSACSVCTDSTVCVSMQCVYRQYSTVYVSMQCVCTDSTVRYVSMQCVCTDSMVCVSMQCV